MVGKVEDAVEGQFFVTQLTFGKGFQAIKPTFDAKEVYDDFANYPVINTVEPVLKADIELYKSLMSESKEGKSFIKSRAEKYRKQKNKRGKDMFVKNVVRHAYTQGMTITDEEARKLLEEYED